VSEREREREREKESERDRKRGTERTYMTSYTYILILRSEIAMKL
jgi:hypothetical protein